MYLLRIYIDQQQSLGFDLSGFVAFLKPFLFVICDLEEQTILF